MFRSVRARLVAAYVFAAFVLVTIATIGITIFSLSIYAISAREGIEAVAHAAPDEVRSQIARYGSLEVASTSIVRHLTRPGVIVAMLEVDATGRMHFIAAGHSDETGRIDVRTEHGLGFILGPPPTIGNAPRPLGWHGSHLDGRDEPRVPNERPPYDGFGGPHVGPGGPDDGHIPPGLKLAPLQFPLGLNNVLHVEPATVSVDRVRLRLWPDPAPLVRWIDDFWLAALPTGLLVVVLAWFFGRSITNGAMRPLIETTASLERFAAGDFTPRPILTDDRSEIGALVRAYNGAAAQVSKAFEERTKAEERMRQFVADAGHELRTPLTVVMGFIDVLRRRALPDATQSTKIYETMLAESRRMRLLIDKLISLARLENPEQREPDAVDVADLASRVVGALGGLQSSPRLRLHADRQIFVRAHELELHEAISNLVENALKYAPESPVDVTVRVDGGDAVVTVTDRGPGLCEDERARVFERFYRGENRTDAEGFGLGLAIAKRAVERAGGTIGVRSAPGDGSTFEIRIPLLDAEREPEVAFAR
jgi:two-component system OmpR family sensor kinase